jgi:hypothetical protein
MDRLPILFLFLLVFLKLPAQVYDDYVGAGHDEGITVLAVVNINSMDGRKLPPPIKLFQVKAWKVNWLKLHASWPRLHWVPTWKPSIM